MFSKKFQPLNILRRCFSNNIIKQSGDKAPIIRESLQFSKAKLTDFGELPLGSVPDALNYDFRF